MQRDGQKEIYRRLHKAITLLAQARRENSRSLSRLSVIRRRLGIDSSVVEPNASLGERIHRNTEEPCWDSDKRLAAEASIDSDGSKVLRQLGVFSVVEVCDDATPVDPVSLAIALNRRLGQGLPVPPPDRVPPDASKAALPGAVLHSR